MRSNRYRSEEHTSELQSRFGISYAVFCLKKKKKTHRGGTSQTGRTNARHSARRRAAWCVRCVPGGWAFDAVWRYFVWSFISFFLIKGPPPKSSPFPPPALFRF